MRMVLAMPGFLLELLPCDLLVYFEHGDISSFAAELVLIFIKEPWAAELFVEKLGNSAVAPSHGRIRTAFAAAIRSVRGKSSAELTERARAERSVLVRQRGLCWLSLVHCATRWKFLTDAKKFSAREHVSPGRFKLFGRHFHFDPKADEMDNFLEEAKDFAERHNYQACITGPYELLVFCEALTKWLDGFNSKDHVGPHICRKVVL